MPTYENAADTSDHSQQLEITNLASWSVSSSKPGYGVEQLLDPSLDTLWQSEGPQPHLVNIEYRKRMKICQISVFVDITHDDSYTPHKLSIRAGNSYADLQEVKVVEFEQPRGWQHVKMGDMNDYESSDEAIVNQSDPDAFCIRANLIQIVVVANHLNGKDTHIRHIKIYAPREPQTNILSEEDLPPFTSVVFTQHRTLR